MEIKSLEKTDFEKVFKAFSMAFADYEIQLTVDELKSMLKRRGFRPDLSFGIFVEDDIIAFTLNGVGIYNKIQMAYDTGTGTLKEYRGQGLATKIFEYSIPFFKENNINHYLLEVLQHNPKAVSIYQRIGFKVTREFNYFVFKNDELNNDHINSPSKYQISRFDISNYNKISEFWDFTPSWQNSFESINRSNEKFINLGVFSDDQLLGYCIFEPNSGDISQLAVDLKHRRNGIASLLLREVCRLNKNSKIKLINSDVCCSSIVNFFKSKNIDISGKQFEMIKDL